MTRVNARLDAELAQRLLVVRDRTGQSTSDLIKASLRAYLDQVEARAGAAKLLSDFIASGRGPADLSTSYKTELTRSLEKKNRP
jgi:predicted DNA-binding protein